MSIIHHPDDATLMSFAAGTLSEPFAILIASHLELCGRCRQANLAMAALGGLVMESGLPSQTRPDALDRLLARLDEPADAGATKRRPMPALPPGATGLPQPLARLVGGGIDAITWHSVVPGVQDRMIKFEGKSEGHSLRFLRARPGMTLPEHTHVGTELTLVLAGALRDGEAVLGPGDISDMDEDGTHTPRVHGSETCICVFAHEAAPRFKRVKHRILQKLIGI